MRVHQQSLESNSLDIELCDFDPGLILLFISPGYANPQALLDKLHRLYPNADITGCSTSGEIIDTTVEDNSVVINMLKFEKTRHIIKSVELTDKVDSQEAGKLLFESLASDDLQHILILSDGLVVNGADLVVGLAKGGVDKVGITGGLAGDGTDFNETFTIENAKILKGCVTGIGLYGTDLHVNYSSLGGWDSFGIERKVTKSDKSVLYELDGKPALDLYKSFLGPHAADLPASALLFPLSLRTSESEDPLVRTILAVNEEDKSMTFAGNIPEGAYVRLMKANIDRLIKGAEGSAEISKSSMKSEAEFALLISCVGRRLVLKQCVEEEIEAVRDVLGKRPFISGFYSYGELAPFGKFQPCQLHNQTMTITTFSERAAS